jgi:hypothetical protein
VSHLRTEGDRAQGHKQQWPSLRMAVALGISKRWYSLWPTPFTWIGVGAHILRAPPQAREPQ